MSEDEVYVIEVRASSKTEGQRESNEYYFTNMYGFAVKHDRGP